MRHRHHAAGVIASPHFCASAAIMFIPSRPAHVQRPPSPTLLGHVLAPKAFIFGHYDITVNLRLTGKSKTRFIVVRWEVEPPFLSACLVDAKFSQSLHF